MAGNWYDYFRVAVATFIAISSFVMLITVMRKEDVFNHPIICSVVGMTLSVGVACLAWWLMTG